MSSEITLLVGSPPQSFKAIKGLLSISSRQFRELLEEHADKNEICLPDMDGDAFKIVMNHVKGNVVDKELTEANMCHILYIANKFCLSKLTKSATKFVSKKLNKHNLFELYQFAHRKNDTCLKQLLWQWLGRRSSKITEPIIGQIFKSLKRGEIAELLQTDYIAIDEQRIFTHCMHWLRTHYTNNNDNSSDEKLDASPRRTMSEFLPFIRFPLMSHKFLCTNVYSTGILSDTELFQIVRAKTLNDVSLSAYNASRRSRRRQFWGAGSNELEELSDADELDDFDDLNLRNDSDGGNEEDEEKLEYAEITDKIKAVANSGEWAGYPMTKMYVDGTGYWCSATLAANSQCWIMFDCGDYQVHKFGIKYQGYYPATTIKVYTTDERNTPQKYWSKLTKKLNLTSGTQLNELRIDADEQRRFFIVAFENWSQYPYVGVERIRFCSVNE